MAEHKSRPINQYASLEQIMPKCLTELGLTDTVYLERIQGFWPQIVGENIAGYAWPVGLAHGKLAVQINEPGWKEVLGPLAEDMLQKINQKLPSPEVQQIALFYAPAVRPSGKPKA